MVAKKVAALEFDEERPPAFPWPLLTCLRVLRGMAVPGDLLFVGDPFDDDEGENGGLTSRAAVTSSFNNSDALNNSSSSSLLHSDGGDAVMVEQELKFDDAAITMYSADLLTSLRTLLSRIADFYAQPSASLTFFGPHSTAALVSLLDASVSLLHRLTVAVIAALDEEFKDSLLAPVFLKIHSLTTAIAAASCPVSTCLRVIHQTFSLCDASKNLYSIAKYEVAVKQRNNRWILYFLASFSRSSSFPPFYFSFIFDRCILVVSCRCVLERRPCKLDTAQSVLIVCLKGTPDHNNSASP